MATCGQMPFLDQKLELRFPIEPLLWRSTHIVHGIRYECSSSTVRCTKRNVNRTFHLLNWIPKRGSHRPKGMNGTYFRSNVS